MNFTYCRLPVEIYLDYFRPARKRPDLSGRATVVVDLTESDCEEHQTVTSSSTSAISDYGNTERTASILEPTSTSPSSSANMLLPPEAEIMWNPASSSSSTSRIIPPEAEITWNRASVSESSDDSPVIPSHTSDSRRCGSSQLTEPVSCSRVST